MTPEFTRRVKESIAECDRYINLESARSADLRPPEITQRLATYVAHRAKLVNMIKEVSMVEPIKDWSLYRIKGAAQANRDLTAEFKKLLDLRLTRGETERRMLDKLREYEKFGATDTAVREVLAYFLDDLYRGE